ncbi:cysteine hydrolase family protein [Sphingomonas profundi]|uniref:cysteine hydrolase family protein n=1 Tax=Alterirhizorhabdus profundi TaxID=2681549 RepID=UPI0012E71055|nr:isochorismatase family protein [Sphingomonas profundi]
MRSIVIVVDAQRDFMAADGALSVAGAEALIAPMAAWLGALDPDETAGVLFTFDTHLPDIYAGSAEAAEFPVHCVRDTPGWESMLPADPVDRAIPVFRLEKGVFAMWQEEDLVVRDARDPASPALPRDLFFTRLREQGVDHAIVIGVAADYCVRYAVEGLVSRGFSVEVPAALTRGIARQIDAVVAQDFAGKPVRVT